MLQNESRLKIVDNSGATEALVIRCMGGSFRKSSNIGDIVICTVKKCLPNGEIKKGKIVRVLIVRTKKGLLRKNGEKLKFNTNAGILIRDDLSPVGTRIFGPICREIREKGYSKIISLAQEVL